MRPFIPALCLAVSGASAAVPQAEQAWQAGRYEVAFAQSIEAAENGDADAQFMLGEAFRQGKGTPTNILMADVWYFRAASKGHVKAAAELGMICLAEHRNSDARRWLRFAADYGDVGAMGSLAALLFNASEDEQDKKEALALMARAASSGSKLAKEQMARIQGTDDPETPKTAPALAAAQDHPVPLPVRAAAPLTVAPPLAVAKARLPEPLLALAPPFAPQSEIAPVVAPARESMLTASPMARVPLATAAPLLHRAMTSAIAAHLPMLRPLQPVTYAPPAHAAVPSTVGSWRVQVGAFRSEAAAQRAWGRLVLRVGALHGGKPYLERINTLTRVQADASSRTNALALCRAIRAANWACFVSPRRPIAAYTTAAYVPARDRTADRSS